jgi:hypothetical protein
MKHFVIIVFLVFGTISAKAAEPTCARDAAEQAKKLLAFHLGEGFEDRFGFEVPSPKTPIKNPAHPKQIFQVLEVEGFVSPHGRYRMRFIFYTLPRGCLLMGQEILEYANL